MSVSLFLDWSHCIQCLFLRREWLECKGKEKRDYTQDVSQDLFQNDLSSSDGSKGNEGDEQLKEGEEQSTSREKNRLKKSEQQRSSSRGKDPLLFLCLLPSSSFVSETNVAHEVSSLSASFDKSGYYKRPSCNQISQGFVEKERIINVVTEIVLAEKWKSFSWERESCMFPALFLPLSFLSFLSSFSLISLLTLHVIFSPIDSFLFSFSLFQKCCHPDISTKMTNRE